MLPAIVANTGVAALDAISAILPSPENCGCAGRKIEAAARYKARMLYASGQYEEAERVIREAQQDLQDLSARLADRDNERQAAAAERRAQAIEMERQPSGEYAMGRTPEEVADIHARYAEVKARMAARKRGV